MTRATRLTADRHFDARRVRRIVQRLGAEWLDPLFARRRPGAALRALIRAAAPFVRVLQPNDQWSLGAFVGQWLRLLDAQPRHPLPAAKRIFMFGCYRGQFTRDLVFAVLLAWRGHRVTFGYFPKLQSPIKEPVIDAPGASEYLRAILGPVAAQTGGRISCIDLSALAESGENIDLAYLASQTRADTVMRVRQEKYDPLDPETKWALEFYGEMGRRAQRAAHNFFSRHSGDFDLCVIGNGASFETGHFAHTALAHGIPLTTHEKFAFSNVIVVNHGGPFFQFTDLDRIWNRRRELGFLDGALREFAIAKGRELLNQRRRSTGRVWGWQYQKGRPTRSPEEIEARLGVQRHKFVLVCPNVPFDAGFDGWLELFPSMRQWLVETVRYLLENGKWPVVVRAHPAEVRPSFDREQIACVLAEAGIASERLIIIPGGSDLNTYDLMPLCRYGVVFASTTGVEIAMEGKPVLAGASVYYGRCGITRPARTKTEYFESLAALDEGDDHVDPAGAEDAAMLYFMFHYLLQWRFPYDKPSQIVDCPPHRLIDHPELESYLETLDVLAMTPDEFDQALPALVTMDKIRRRWAWDHLWTSASGE
ncbi:MAG TPA: hypothetical protein VHN11_04600 [Xanthobacteraceae bacterium]|nr:hypothetical protein [Xanthobacteraceae bacterium]